MRNQSRSAVGIALCGTAENDRRIRDEFDSIIGMQPRAYGEKLTGFLEVGSRFAKSY